MDAAAARGSDCGGRLTGIEAAACKPVASGSTGAALIGERLAGLEGGSGAALTGEGARLAGRTGGKGAGRC